MGNKCTSTDKAPQVGSTNDLQRQASPAEVRQLREQAVGIVRNMEHHELAAFIDWYKGNSQRQQYSERTHADVEVCVSLVRPLAAAAHDKAAAARSLKHESHLCCSRLHAISRRGSFQIS